MISPLRAFRCAVIVAAIAGTPAAAQNVAGEAAAIENGRLRFSYAAREGVCGDGDRIWRSDRRSSDWERWCDPGPVFVAVTKRDGRVTDLDVHVGGRWRSTARGRDLGPVSVRAAAGFLLDLVESAETDVAKDAIHAATLADSVDTWPRLLGVARDARRPRSVRREAAQWVGMEASRALADEAEVSRERDTTAEMRTQAVFALSQLPDAEAVPRLLAVARDHRMAHVRQRALFWLGQTGDERALALFERILSAGNR